MKGFMKEFKEFISRGNVMDMAIGIIIGGAFTAIVTALVDSIIMPLITGIFGGLSVKEWAFHIGKSTIAVGALVQAIINFVLITLVLFSIIKAINKVKKKEEEAEEETTTKECPFCKSEIPIEATRCPHCTSELK